MSLARLEEDMNTLQRIEYVADGLNYLMEMDGRWGYRFTVADTGGGTLCLVARHAGDTDGDELYIGDAAGYLGWQFGDGTRDRGEWPDLSWADDRSILARAILDLLHPNPYMPDPYVPDPEYPDDAPPLRCDRCGREISRTRNWANEDTGMILCADCHFGTAPGMAHPREECL